MNRDYEGLRLLKRVKTMCLSPLHGDEIVNGYLAKGWTVVKMDVLHNKVHPSIVWILGHKESGEK